MPRRWTIEEENQKRRELIELYINQNKTIGDIGKLLGIAEQTVFERLKRFNIPTCPERKPHYLNRKTSELNFPDFSDDFAEFVGIILGDGHIGTGQIWIYFDSIMEKEYVDYVKKLLKSLFKVSPGIRQRTNQNTIELFISSVDLINYLRSKGLFNSNKVKSQVDVPSWLFNKDSYLKSFLRGFFDTDGSIYLLKFGVQMSFSNCSIPLLRSTRRILLKLGYYPSNVSNYKLYLTRKPDLYRYIKEIGMNNPHHLERAKKFGII